MFDFSSVTSRRESAFEVSTMTWIVGSPTSFGYAMGIADVRVTWGKDSAARDCLQKVYHVAPFIVAGFSGSVTLGFRLLGDLARFLSPLPEPGYSFIPRWVAWKWHRRARRLFRDALDGEKELGSSVMIMGVRPTDNSGCVGGGHPDVIVMSHCRQFEPDYAKLGDFKAIGSGNDSQRYQSELQFLRLNPWHLMQAEINNPGGRGQALSSSIARVLLQNPWFGVSTCIQCVEVGRNRVAIRPLLMTRYAADGEITTYECPRVARGYAEFASYAKQEGLSAAAASG
jgi:hypothetical protein